jgi:spore germination protein GerM
LALVAALVVAPIALLSACRGERTPPDAPPVAAAPPAEAAPPDAAAADSPGSAPMAKASVTLYFPSATDDALAVETREIVDTKGPGDRGTQILAALLAGPRTEGTLPVFPEGTTLRKLWVRDDGSAFADFSVEFANTAAGGSSDEILTLYAIIDSLTENVAEIRRVGFLVAGRERDTLGHLDLRRPLPADLSLAQPAKTTE